MRRWNARIGALLLILLVIHLVTGAFQVMGLIQGGQTWRAVLSWAMLCLLAVHAVLGILLTRDSLRSGKKKGTRYVRQNARFWISRISGFVMVFLAAWHVLFFIGADGGAFRLKLFGPGQLAASILLIAALLCHILTNIRPLIIALGAEPVRKFVRDIILILLVVLVFGGIAFLVYYLRWNVWWR